MFLVVEYYIWGVQNKSSLSVLTNLTVSREVNTSYTATHRHTLSCTYLGRLAQESPIRQCFQHWWCRWEWRGRRGHSQVRSCTAPGPPQRNGRCHLVLLWVGCQGFHRMCCGALCGEKKKSWDEGLARTVSKSEVIECLKFGQQKRLISYGHALWWWCNTYTLSKYLLNSYPEHTYSQQLMHVDLYITTCHAPGL